MREMIDLIAHGFLRELDRFSLELASCPAGALARSPSYWLQAWVLYDQPHRKGYYYHKNTCRSQSSGTRDPIEMICPPYRYRINIRVMGSRGSRRSDPRD